MHGPHRPRGTPPASRVLTVRISEDTGSLLDARAKAMGLTAGTIARAALISALDADDVHTIRVRRYRPTNPPPTVDVQAIAALREAVGEAVGTLRQVAGIDRSRGGSRLVEIDGAISDLIIAAERLDTLKSYHEGGND